MSPTVLRENPCPSDESWDFIRIALQPAKNPSMGKHVSFKPQAITIDMAKFPDNRILRRDDPAKFILASFAEFRFPDTGSSVTRDYMIRFFKAGLNLNNVHYRFYGHSNSQLRGRSCFLREAQTDTELDHRISLLGDFNKLMNAAKRAKRIGLLFTAASIDWMLDERYTKDIPDIASNGQLFSDGCGLISKRLAAQVSRKRRIIFHSKNYTPCVYQIRYKGYKGVVMLHPDLDLKKEAMIHFRTSQKKFTATGDDIFSVVDYSVPYAYHRLNDDIIVLLSSLGVTTEKLLLKQQAYFDWIIQAGISWEVAFDFLTSLNKFDLAEKLLLEGIDCPQVKSQIQAIQTSEVVSFRKKDHFRTRMIIHKSRFLFGVCDPYQILREGEVHVRITVPRKGATTLTQTDLLVVRNPCLHPGDCLKLRAVSHPRLSHLVDCIVFATVGRRAAPSMSSGGDLDGDKFFVMFDPDLIPTKVAESYNYPEGRAPPPKNVTRQDLAQHFASYNSVDMSRVASLHRKWVYASSEGAMSSQCQELNALYSSSVDGGKIKIPDRLKSPPNPEGPYVLDLLADAAKVFADNFLQTPRGSGRDSEINRMTAHDTIVQLLSAEKLAVSEYEVVTMGMDLARRHSLDPRQYLTHVNFSALTTAQKHGLSVLLGLTPDEHPYVWNSLIRSDIITPHELHYRSLDGPLRLQRLYASHIQGRAAFFEYLREAVEDYTRKLIIIKTDDRFSIGIFVKGQLPWNEDGDIDQNVTICSFMPQSTDSGRSTYRQGTKGYRFHCNENSMEIFNCQRSDTFIFITRPPDRSGEDVAVSIALQKISKFVQKQCGRVNRTPVSAIEIHVISNRDRVAHQAFDLRFEHVQTEEFLGRFDHRPIPYVPHSLAGYDWANSPEKRVIFTGTENEARQEINRLSGDILDGFMDFALHYRAEDQLFWMFKELISREPLDHGRIALRMSRHPPLAYVILKKFLGEDTSELPRDIMGLAPSIIRDIIRSANQLGIAALVALEKLSKDICRLDIRQYFELLWLAGVSIRSRKLVQEVLMVLHECCEPKRRGRGILEYTHRHALAVVFDHAEEAADECPCDDTGRPVKQRVAPVKVKLVPIGPVDDTEEAESDNPFARSTSSRHVMAHVRVDAATTVRIHSHVRLQVASQAEHSTVERAVVDAIVIQASKGELRLLPMHTLPPEFEVIDWNMYPAGSIATSRAMLDAILRLAEEGSDCCRFHHNITRTDGTSIYEHDATAENPLGDNSDIDLSFLNQSQRLAVKTAVSKKNGLTLIWGPPGTGKTTVTVQILLRFLRDIDVSEHSNLPKILMTASTHNAVDNVLERLITENGKLKLLDPEHILRVATDPSKVAKAHQPFTLDARVGGSISENPRLIQKAEKRLKDARIIFTTCAGAGLGIMRKFDFETVLIDEASQVTEPCALIPLVKGCVRAVLVGDHVQLRPTVRPMGKALEFDVSLLERLYSSPYSPDVSRVMLEVQYRFSDDIGRFPSTEFYNGQLRSGLQLSQHDEVLKASSFPWPQGCGRLIPNVFVPCLSEEDYGRSSKSNSGQVRLVRHIVALLQKIKTPPEGRIIQQQVPSIAVLTPYTRQVTQLREALPSDITTSTIDGFQGRESDMVIFSTVRCNAEGDIGFVEDPRRLNVAWTRPRLALIIVGDKRTLEENSPLWKKAIKDCAQVEIPLSES